MTEDAAVGLVLLLAFWFGPAVLAAVLAWRAGRRRGARDGAAVLEKVRTDTMFASGDVLTAAHRLTDALADIGGAPGASDAAGSLLDAVVRLTDAIDFRPPAGWRGSGEDAARAAALRESVRRADGGDVPKGTDNIRVEIHANGSA